MIAAPFGGLRVAIHVRFGARDPSTYLLHRMTHSLQIRPYHQSIIPQIAPRILPEARAREKHQCGRLIHLEVVRSIILHLRHHLRPFVLLEATKVGFEIGVSSKLTHLDHDDHLFGFEECHHIGRRTFSAVTKQLLINLPSRA